nr:carbonic anhydrase 7-like [Megalopta genalis]
MPPKVSHKKSKKIVVKSTKPSRVISTSSTGLPKWQQSPIDLSKTATWTKKFPPLYLTNYWPDEGAATMTNTGKTVSIEFLHEKLPILRGGPLNDDEFQFANVQFRWGPENSFGAEHSVDGIWYSMEAQVMHWNTRYGTMDRCFDKPDGIAILSYLIQVVGCPGIPDNPSLSPITDKLYMIKRMGTKADISATKCLSWMLEACKGEGYYVYHGSLTTPPYNECVLWIISSSVTKMSLRQIDAFRSLYDCKLRHILENGRPQQHLRRRRIFFATDSAVA